MSQAKVRPKPNKRVLIEEPFQPVGARNRGDAKVPQLVLSGERLKAAGFPIGSNAYLTTDGRGEIALHRLELGVPRRLRIRAGK